MSQTRHLCADPVIIHRVPVNEGGTCDIPFRHRSNDSRTNNSEQTNVHLRWKLSLQKGKRLAPRRQDGRPEILLYNQTTITSSKVGRELHPKDKLLKRDPSSCPIPNAERYRGKTKYKYEQALVHDAFTRRRRLSQKPLRRPQRKQYLKRELLTSCPLPPE